jgi:hypothetical protein
LHKAGYRNDDKTMPSSEKITAEEEGRAGSPVKSDFFWLSFHLLHWSRKFDRGNAATHRTVLYDTPGLFNYALSTP